MVTTFKSFWRSDLAGGAKRACKRFTRILGIGAALIAFNCIRTANAGEVTRNYFPPAASQETGNSSQECLSQPDDLGAAIMPGVATDAMPGTDAAELTICDASTETPWYYAV